MARRELAKSKKESMKATAAGLIDKKASCDSSKTHGSKEGSMNRIYASSREPVRPAIPPILDMKMPHTYTQRGMPSSGFSHHPWRIPENSKLLDSLNFLASATLEHQRSLQDDQEREKLATPAIRRRRSQSDDNDIPSVGPRAMHKSSGYSTGSSKYRMVESDADYISDDSDLDEDMKVGGSSRRLADFYGMPHRPSYYPSYNQRYDDNRSYPSTGAEYDDDVISDEEGEDMEIEIFQAIQSLEMLRNSRGAGNSKSDGSKQHKMKTERVGSYYPAKPLKKRMKI